MPSIAFLDALIKTKSNGMIIGKLKIAIKELLFDAFEAMALVNVKVDDRPIDPNNSTSIYIGLS